MLHEHVAPAGRWDAQGAGTAPGVTRAGPWAASCVSCRGPAMPSPVLDSSFTGGTIGKGRDLARSTQQVE